MGTFWPLWLLLATLGLAQQMEPMNMCTQSTTAPACVLTFTPWMAPQVAPTSTYYEAIVTHQLNIIDCRYCSVINVEDNPTPTGFFTGKVTSSILTATRVTCMPETTAITRRDYRGYPENEELSPRSTVPAYFVQRDTAAEESLSEDGGSWDTMQAINEYRKQIYSAIMAVNLILSPLDRQWMCDALRDPELKLSLSQQNLYPDQIGNLVCYSAQFGIMFNGTTFEILDQLTATATSLLLAAQANFNASTTSSQLCNDLGLDSSLYTTLHIDSHGIYSVLCSGFASGASTSTSSNTITSVDSASAGASTSAVTFTSWGSNGSVVVTGTAVDVSWSFQGGTGAASATLSGSNGTLGDGNITGTAVSTGGISIGTGGSFSWSAGGSGSAVTSAGTAISASLSASAGANASASFGGSGPVATSAASSISLAGNSTSVAVSGSGALPGNASIVQTSTAASIGTSLSWTFGASGNATVGATATAWSSATGGASATAPSPTWSWTTFTNADGSVVISGTAAASGSTWSWQASNSTGLATADGNSASTAVGTGATASWTSIGAGGATVFSYSGVAWTSWVVSSNPTVGIITGTGATIEWGTAGASALITGAGQVATFTIYEVRKTIIVTATAIAQTWSAYGANTAGIITATGTSGTWTFEPQSLTSMRSSATAITGTGVASTLATTVATTVANGTIVSTSLLATGGPDHGNATSTPSNSATASEPNSVSSSAVSSLSSSVEPSFSILTTSNDFNVTIPGVPHGTGIPFVPSNLTASIASGTTFTNATSSLPGTVITSWAGNATGVINGTTVAVTGISNTSTTVVGTIIQSSLASTGTGVVTVTNPENGTNITLSISTPTFSPPKSFSYPAWTTSTKTGDSRDKA